MTGVGREFQEGEMSHRKYGYRVERVESLRLNTRLQGSLLQG